MADTQTAYATKAAFNEQGLAPHLSSTADSWSICLKDLACEASGADHKPLSKAERAVLDDDVDTYQDISDTNLRRPQHHHHHHQEGEIGARLKACDHVFCKTCIEEWFKEKNTCPLCRITLFPKTDESWGGLEILMGQGREEVARELLELFWVSAVAE